MKKTYEKKKHMDKKNIWKNNCGKKQLMGKITGKSVKILTVGTYLSNTGHSTPYQSYPDPSVIKSTPTANNPKSMGTPLLGIIHQLL